jgi:adenylosuccinate synthase
MRELTVVVGGQYGSEGKGAVIGHIAHRPGHTDSTGPLDSRDLVIRVGGPNAGHTVVDPDGQVYRLRQLPAAAPISNCHLHIAAGSEIDPDVLFDEIRLIADRGTDLTGRLTIHPSATIIEPRHRDEEKSAQLTDRIGSTGKGIGAARADRLMRNAHTARVHNLYHNHELAPWLDRPHVDLRRHVVIEGTQGYGLGLHTDSYPFTTSGDCTAIDFLAQAQVSPWAQRLDRMTVWVVCRAYPIRVAGNSGPLHGETSWQALHLPEEHTTVTQKVRRVGTWDSGLVAEAVQANGGHPVVKIALMMADQMFPQIAGVTEQDVLDVRTGFALTQFIEKIEQECGAIVGLVGTGPDSCAWMRED